MKAHQTDHRTSLRTRTWALVLAGALAVGGIAALSVRGAAADPVLPSLTPAELLGKVAAAQVGGLTATFEQRSDLGLPALPADLGDDSAVSSALAMFTGTHTVRVWTAGQQKSKVALVDGSTESSVTRNGADVWVWSSKKQEAVHSKVTATATRPSASVNSPTEAIKTMLDRLGSSTEVTTSGTGYVAGRAVYQLVLSPRDPASLINQVRVSVDAEHFVPLGLKVIADGGQEAVAMAATSVDFAVPDAQVFDFRPPAGVKVSEHSEKKGERPTSEQSTGSKPKTFGTGWTTVAVLKLPKSGESTQQTQALLNSLPVVTGTWGKGRLLSTLLVNAVITDDGRVAIGSVDPKTLDLALANR